MKTFFNKTREQRELPSAEGYVVGAAGNYSPIPTVLLFTISHLQHHTSLKIG